MGTLLTKEWFKMACRITSRERKRIKTLREKKKLSRREIGDILWRDHTVLMKEYKRNKKRWWSYDPKYADHKAYVRVHFKKKQCKKIRMNNVLEKYIIEKLEVGRSAEKVAGRWNNVDRKIFSEVEITSWISIRRYIDSRFWSYLKYILIQEKKIRKYKKRAKRWKREWWNIQHRVFIDLRPIIIGLRTELWHVEVDFIESIKWDCMVLLVCIDKLSREKYAVKLPNRKSDLVFNALRKIIEKHNIKSMTFDNDNGFAKHYNLWIPTYFCHTYSSREKWQVENANRSYRKFFPKKTELKNISQNNLDLATDYLNNLPMKCLSYLTPHEYIKEFNAHLNTNLLLCNKVVQ